MNYKLKKEIYLLNLSDGSMRSHPPKPETQSEEIHYDVWLRNMVSGKVWEEDVPDFTEHMNLSNIRLSSEMSRDINFRFRVTKDDRYIWYEVNICFVEDLALLVVKDIHELMKKEIFHKISSFYKWVRKRMALMASMEKEHGLVVLEMKSGQPNEKGKPYRVRFIDPEFRRALAGYYRNELQIHKEQVEKFLQRLLDRDKESEIEFMKIRMENDSTCWVQLYGKVLYTASGKRIVSMMAVNAYDYQEKEQFQELKDSVEHFIFEWSIEEDIITLVGPWEDKFAPNGEEVHKRHDIEPYIYKNDLLKFQKISNLVLSGKSQEDILLRFYTSSGEKEYSWCTVSFLSVMYDNSIPMFAIGRVKDIDHEINQVLKLPDSEGSENKNSLSEWDFIANVLKFSNQKQTHALITSELRVLIRKDTGIDKSQNILSKEWMKRFYEILSVKDKLFLEEDILYIFLYNVDINEVKYKQARIKRILEAFGEGDVIVNTGMAVWPDDGISCFELKKKALNMMKDTGSGKAGDSEHFQSQDILQRGSFSAKLPEMIDEWYNSVKLNQQLQNQMELVESQLLLSQIKPHFIYNVLANIKAVMFEDRDKACELLVRFTRYLRSSFRSIGREGLVPFTEIIKCLNDYIELEKYRFGDKISVVYDLQYTEFVFTYFILQPIVENSIRHGICKKDSPGTLFVRTYKEKEKIYIVIEDDGVGFEILKKELKEGGHGIGLKNVELRLRYLLGGELHVRSSSGIGTRIELVIPEI